MDFNRTGISVSVSYVVASKKTKRLDKKEATRQQ